jgi:hypothetical protein
MKRVLLVIATVAVLCVPTPSAVGRAHPSGSIGVPGDYPTIQAAVDHAAPGDTVVVGPGTYVEEVVVDHDLTIRGSGVGVTVVRAPEQLTSYGVHLPDGRELTAIVRVGNGARVSISDLTVSGPIPCGIEVSGIHALQGATLDLTRARVTGIQADPATCAPEDAAGRAIVFGTPAHIDVDGQRGTTAYGRVSDVQVDHYQHAGISIAGPATGPVSRMTVVHSMVLGGWQIPGSQTGFWIDDGAEAVVRDNVIRDNVCGGPYCGSDPINDVQSTGVLVLPGRPGSQIVDNVLGGNDVGIYQVGSPDCCLVAHNRLVDNRWFGIVVQDGDGSTEANSITGGEIGIGVVADAVDTVAYLRGDRIRGTSLAAVREIECCGFDATAVVRPGGQ